MTATIGISLFERFQRPTGDGPTAVHVAGLVGGQAQIGAHQSISVVAPSQNDIQSLTWGNVLDGDQYGTGLSPTDFSDALGGLLFLTVSTESGVSRKTFPIIGTLYTSNVAEVTQIIVQNLGAGQSEVILNGAPPFAGSYIIETALLESGLPVLIRPADWSDAQTAGQYVLTPPLWLVPDDGTVVFEQIILDEDNQEIVLESPLIAESSKGYTYHYEAENMAGRTVPAPVVIKAASLIDVIFNDSVVQTSDSQETRQFVAAFRLQIDVAQFSGYTTFAFGDAFAMFWGGSQLTLSVKPSLLPNRNILLGDTGVITCSVLIALDLDAGLDGDTAVVWLHDGNGWAEVLRANEDDGNTVIEQKIRIGSQNSTTAGPDFQLAHFYWQHDAIPADLIGLRDALFQSDGSVIIPEPDGTAAGLVPRQYLKTSDFVTGRNSGTGEDWELRRNPITLTQV